MKVELKNVFDATLCDQEISINNEYDEYGYIFNYIWNKMLPHGRNMEEVKSEIENFAYLGKLSVIYDGKKYRINIRARFLRDFLRFYKSNLTTMQIKRLQTDVNERCALAMIIVNNFFYNGHLPIQKSLLKAIKRVFSLSNSDV